MQKQEEKTYVSEYKQPRKLFTLNLTEAQREAFEEIKEMYGASSASKGLILLVQDALRAKANNPEIQIADDRRERKNSYLFHPLYPQKALQKEKNAKEE